MDIGGVYDLESSKLCRLALLSSFGVRRRSDVLPGNNACVYGNQPSQIKSIHTRSDIRVAQVSIIVNVPSR